MRTNSKARKTMPVEWQELFKKYKSKYCEDGFECCVARPESGAERGLIQTATRRSELVARHWARNHGYKDVIEFMDNFFGHTDYMPGIVDVCCTDTDSGIYLYDRLECMRHGYMLEDSESKRRNQATGEEMGNNLYNRVPLHLCYKIRDIWDVPRGRNKRRIYNMACWQYVEMLKPDSITGLSIYDRVETWEDLPDWCMWKWRLPTGEIIEGREEAFEAMKAKHKKDARYVPTMKSAKEVKNDD